MKRHAIISECGNYRWELSRHWGPGPVVYWCMANPSTADGSKDDPTLCRIIKFSQRWHFGGLVVVNLYPRRTSNPDECRKWADYERNGPDWYARDAIEHNRYERLRDVAMFADCHDAPIICAWGNAGDWDEGFTCYAEETLEEFGAKLWCLGLTKSGQPKHPLARGKHRIADDQIPIPFGHEASWPYNLFEAVEQ